MTILVELPRRQQRPCSIHQMGVSSFLVSVPLKRFLRQSSLDLIRWTSLCRAVLANKNTTMISFTRREINVDAWRTVDLMYWCQRSLCLDWLKKKQNPHSLTRRLTMDRRFTAAARFTGEGRTQDQPWRRALSPRESRRKGSIMVQYLLKQERTTYFYN